MLRPLYVVKAMHVRRYSRPWPIFALILALACGQSAGVQLVAWAGMLATRLTTTSVSEAVASTFDGSSPCALCSMAAALERNECDKDVPTGDPRLPTKVVKQDMLISSMPYMDAAAVPQQLLDFSLVRQAVPQALAIAPELPPPRA